MTPENWMKLTTATKQIAPNHPHDLLKTPYYELVLLETLQLECTRGVRTLFSELAFELRAGELLHVVGANGSGKTSLLRILCGLLAPSAGEVRWNGQDIRALEEDYRRRLNYIGHANAVKEELTPAENLRIACTFSGKTATSAAIEAALRMFGLAGDQHSPVKSLSQGQRRRAALARLAIADEQPLWLLDEPFTALDERAVAGVQQLIDSHRSRGGMVVMSTHQPMAAPGDGVRTIELARLAA